MIRPRPVPGEKLNHGALTEPRPAAAVILLRGGRETLEVLLVKRTEAARFMAGVWVFPGGAVHTGDGTGREGLQRAAVRELEEEAAVSLPAEALLPYSRWITPEQLKIRFDTHFFLAELPAGAAVRPDGVEVVDACWLTPRAALEGSGAGALLLVFPTIKQLEQLALFASTDELISHAQRSEMQQLESGLEDYPEKARIPLSHPAPTPPPRSRARRH